MYGTFQEQRELWQKAFDQLLKFGSSGPLEAELMTAKASFFNKLGRIHEMKEEIFEAVSQSFLEWYLFNFDTKTFGKSPAILFYTQGLGKLMDREYVALSLKGPWSLFEVTSVDKDRAQLCDLLFNQNRTLMIDVSQVESQVWKIKTGQVVQARLFPLRTAEKSELSYFWTHVWIHSQAESGTLKKLCVKRQPQWSLHEDFVFASLEAAVRTYGIHNQLSVGKVSNWLYQDLWKKYA